MNMQISAIIRIYMLAANFYRDSSMLGSLLSRISNGSYLVGFPMVQTICKLEKIVDVV